MSGRTIFTIGSRRSKLAMTQTTHVVGLLKEAYPKYTFIILEQDTKGDLILDVPLAKIGDKGLFTQELEAGLLDLTIDFAVHSLKDLPTTLPQGLTVGCITERVSPADVVLIRSELVKRGITSLEQLNEHSDPEMRKIGTSSLRRQAQLSARYSNLMCSDCRGNLETRIQKLERGDFSAIVLAHAGLLRQGQSYTDRITQTLTEEDVHYAVGQGALGIECRAGDEDVLQLLSLLHHIPTAQRCQAERSLMRTLEAGCHAPLGVTTSLSEDGRILTLTGRVLSIDGKICIEDSITRTADRAESLGVELAERLIAAGASDVLHPDPIDNDDNDDDEVRAFRADKANTKSSLGDHDEDKLDEDIAPAVCI